MGGVDFLNALVSVYRTDADPITSVLMYLKVRPLKFSN